ncbi:MAG: histidine kinase [Sphaerochaetaceae bacterium]|nr:histidine kinase [Sphaerochaetaceae bacterium]
MKKNKNIFFKYYFSKSSWISKLIILFILLILVILFGSIKARNDMSDNMKKAQELFLSKYAMNISTNITNPIDSTAEKIATILLTLNDNDDYDNLKSQLANMNSASNPINDILIFLPREEGTKFEKITSYNSDIVSLSEFRSLVNPYFLNNETIEYPLNSFQTVLLDAYRDEMNLSTILPVLVQYNSVLSRRNSYAIILFDLTSLLSDMEDSFAFDAYGKENTLIVSIYDKNQKLLETSENIDIPKVDVLVEDSKLKDLNTYRSELGLFTKETKDNLSMYSFNQKLGLYFGITVPSDYISDSSKDIQFYIILISFFILVVFVIFVAFIINSAKDYQEYKIRESKSRFDVLQSRMKPHFLFNTIDSIVYTIEDDEKEEALMSIKALSYILRFDLREESEFVSLASQIKYIRNYVNLQKIKYKDSFTFDFDIEISDYSIEEIKILKYCVQPLVENSFKYSVHQGSNLTHIKVKYKVENNKLNITVFNDQVSISKEKATILINNLQKNSYTKNQNTRGEHLGLVNINQRIKLLYGDNYGITLIEWGETFKIMVSLPLILDSLNSIK